MPVTGAIVRRDGDGRWRKGSSGNPAGRRVELAHRPITLLAREHTAEAVAELRAIMIDEQAPAMARVRAAEVLLNRAYGVPSSEVDLDLADRDAAEELQPIEFVWRMGDTELELEADDGDYEELPPAA
jgi:hypothetical protein